MTAETENQEGKRLTHAFTGKMAIKTVYEGECLQV